jgi:hypothetical protein
MLGENTTIALQLANCGRLAHTLPIYALAHSNATSYRCSYSTRGAAQRQAGLAQILARMKALIDFRLQRLRNIARPFFNT